MAKPTLYIFTISHYCEKARWAFDLLGIDYDAVYLGPGLHIQTSQELGLETSAVPILKTDKEVIQGSSEIISWAEQNATNGKTLSPANCEQQCQKIEQQLDELLGIHMRRYFYSEALIEHPELVKTIFNNHLPPEQKKTLDEIWGFLPPVMIEKMDLGEKQGEESKTIVETELNRLEELLAGGRSYLVGDQLSRADIAAASFCAVMVNPIQHPEFDLIPLPPTVKATHQQWINRPAFDWTRKIYQQHR
jgi:glutathione S-transferase